MASHVDEEHVGIFNIVRAGPVRPCSEERRVELGRISNTVFFEKTKCHSGQRSEACHLGDHVTTAGFLASPHHLPSRVSVITERFLPQHVYPSSKTGQRNFPMSGRRRHVEDKIRTCPFDGLLEVHEKAILRNTPFSCSTLV
jgi:hypothetical protein